MRKKISFILSAAGSIAAVIGLLVLQGHSQRIDGDNNTQIIGDNNQVILGAKSPENQEAILDISVKDIQENWDKFPNDIQAQDNFNRFYKGKLVNWRGTINNVSAPELFFGDPEIEVYFQEGFSISFSGDHVLMDRLSVLKKSDTILVEGVLDSYYSGGVTLKGRSFRTE